MLKQTRFHRGDIWDGIAKKYSGSQLKSVIGIGEDDQVNRIIDKSQKANLHKLMELNGIFPDSSTKILDAGCGSGRILSFFEERSCKAFGLDFSIEMLKLASKFTNKSHLVCASMQGIPFNKNTFDIIVSVGTIKLLPDFDRAVRELVRCTKPNGHLVVLDSPSDRPKYGYSLEGNPNLSYTATFERNGMRLLSQSGVRWPFFLRAYRKLSRKLLLAFFESKITVEPEGHIIFSHQLSKYWKIIYNFGLKSAATLNYFLDKMLAACRVEVLAYEKVFVFQKKL